MKKLIVIVVVLFCNLSARILEVPSGQYPTIQAAIDSSVSSDTVQVQPGIYSENLNFSGKKIFLTSYYWQTMDSTTISETVIDGGYSGPVIVFNQGEDSLSVLNGFTLQHGYNSGGGGGVSCEKASSPTLQNLVITNNIAGSGGGLFCFNHANPKLYNVTIVRNSAIVIGGGILVSRNSEVHLVKTRVISNVANQDGGGLVVSDSSQIDITTSQINNNVSGWSGAGAYIISGSRLLVSESEINGNYATDYGGGIYASESALNFNHVSMQSDTAGSGGAVFLEMCDNVIFSDMDVSENRAVTAGGAFYLYESSPLFSAVNIFGNSAIEEGGGINLAFSVPVFDQVKLNNIYGNHAGYYGNDIYADHDQVLSVVLDTFTLANADSYLVYPADNFNMTINHGLWNQTTEDLHVDPKAGNDSNDGLSVGTAVKTIAAAITRSSGDKSSIHLAAGNYASLVNGEFFPVNLKSHTTLIGNSPGDCRIDASGWSEVIAAKDDSGCVVEYVSLTGGNGYLSGGLMADRSDLKLKNVVFTGNTGIQGSAIHAKNEARISLLNTTLSNNHTYPQMAGPTAFGGIYLDDAHLEMVNSILWNNEGTELSINGAFALAVLAYSDLDTVIKKPGGSHFDQIQWLNGNISAPPQFTDSLNDDFRLTVTSPCIGKGAQDMIIIYNDGQDTLKIPVLAYTGSAPDMGAFEFGDPNIISKDQNMPEEFYLAQNYPNPFNPQTTIRYHLPENIKVQLEIFDILGRRVRTVFETHQAQGTHSFLFNASDLPSGIYYYRLSGANYSAVRKMVLIK